MSKSSESIGEEVREILERNKKKGISEEDRDVLEEQKDFGSIQYRKYPHRIEVDVETEEDEKQITVQKGNDRIFWQVFVDIALEQDTLYGSMRANYESTTNKGNNRFAEELDIFVNPDGEVKSNFLEDVRDMLSYCGRNYFNKEELKSY